MTSKEINYSVIEVIADHLFEFTPEFDKALVAFRNKLDAKIQKERFDSELRYQTDPKAEGNIFTATVDLNNRTYGQLRRIVKISAAIDLLRSPEAFKILTSKKIEKIPLSGESLWRLYSVTTPIYTGVTRYNAKTKQVEFNLMRQHDGTLLPIDQTAEIEIQGPPRDKKEVQDLFTQQKFFNEALYDVLGTQTNSANSVANLMPPGWSGNNAVKVTFEEKAASLRK